MYRNCLQYWWKLVWEGVKMTELGWGNFIIIWRICVSGKYGRNTVWPCFSNLVIIALIEGYESSCDCRRPRRVRLVWGVNINIKYVRQKFLQYRLYFFSRLSLAQPISCNPILNLFIMRQLAYILTCRVYTVYGGQLKLTYSFSDDDDEKWPRGETSEDEETDRYGR